MLPGSKNFSRNIPTTKRQSEMVDLWKDQVNFHYINEENNIAKQSTMNRCSTWLNYGLLLIYRPSGSFVA